MTTVATRPVAARNLEGGDFEPVLRGEWTKFRTVRGWGIGVLVALALSVVFTFLVANGQHSGTCTGQSPSQATCQAGHPFVPTGPDGQAVADAYYFVERPLTGNATLTTQITSLSGLTSTGPANAAPTLSASRPGLAAWAKAGLLVTPTTEQGSTYAAVMATGAHGIRFQYDYSHDSPGLPGTVTAGTPRWLRLTRTGNTITGYDSTNGTTWTKVGTAHLAGLPATVDIGMFATSPMSFRSSVGAATLATASFDQVSMNGAHTESDWVGHSIGTGSGDFYPILAPGGYHYSGGTFVIRGSGDIAPGVVAGIVGDSTPASTMLPGLIVGLIVMIVVASLFIAAEYRRGLIRATFTATPHRGLVLAAKAAVIGAVAFATGAVTALVAIPLAEHLLDSNGNYLFPVTTLTEARVVVGTAAVVAVTAVGVIAVGAILRKSAGTVTAGVMAIVVPYIIGSAISGSAEKWLFRLTPAAAFSVLGVLPHSSLVSYPYTMANGYYPLAPWAGLAVLCAYAVIALGAANRLFHRRDA